MVEYKTILMAGVLSAGLSVAAVIAAMRIARRLGVVSKPGAGRWSKKETPLLGGAAVLVAFVVSYLVLGEPDGPMIYILVTSGLLFLLGLLDDLRGLRPNVKLIGQGAAACLLIYGGVYVNIWFPVIGIPLSIAWFVGMSNAVNLLDNMDGVASGVCAISAGMLVFHAASADCGEIALAAAALCGACVGFAVFNFHPAKIFLGDSGSLFLGMTLAALGVGATYKEAANVLVTLLVPVMVLGVPLFDMVFVSVLRKGHGRSLTVGGKDHSAHRLVSLGLSERKTALLFYAVCLGLGAASILARANMLVMLLVAGLVGAGLLLWAFLLGRAKVYPEGAESESQALAMRLFEKYRRAAGLAVFDMLALTCAYVGAYFVRFDWHIPGYLGERIPYVLPVILVLKLFSLLLYRVYQIKWNRVERSDIWRLFKALGLGSALSLITVAVESRFELFLVSVLIIDWLFCLVLLGGARLLLPVIAGPGEDS